MRAQGRPARPTPEAGGGVTTSADGAWSSVAEGDGEAFRVASAAGRGSLIPLFLELDPRDERTVRADDVDGPTLPVHRDARRTHELAALVVLRPALQLAAGL